MRFRSARRFRQVIRCRLLGQQEEGVEAFVLARVALAVEIGLGFSPCTSRTFALSPQLVDRPELDRVGRAGLGAGGLEAVLQAVVAERALVGLAVDRLRPITPNGQAAMQ